MKIFSKQVSTTVAGGLAVALLLAACGTSSKESTSETGLAGPGVDEASKTITMGDLSIQSGPAAFLGTPVSAGIKAYFDSVNAADGLDGWKVKVDLKDTAYNPQKAVQIFNEFKDDVAIINTIGSPITDAILSTLEQEKLITGGVGLAWTDSAVLAPLGTPYAPEAANMVSYVAEKVADPGAKFAAFYQNDGFGESVMAGYDSAVETLGLDSVAQENYKAGDADFSGQAARLKKSGAEYVLVASQLPPASALVGSAEAIGYKPTWIFLASTFGPKMVTDDGTVDGKATPIASAVTGKGYAAVYSGYADTKAPGFAAMKAGHDSFASSTPLDMYFGFGWALGKMYGAILDKAIASGDLSRAGILAAKQSLGTVDMGGIVASPTFSADLSAPPSRSSTIAKIDDSVFGFLNIQQADYTSKAAETLKH